MPKHDRQLSPGQEREQARIREALIHEIERTTLRAVALEVGMTPTGLRGFVDGTVPYGPTLARLRQWFFRWRNGAGLSPDDVDEMMRQLLRWLPEPEAGVAPVLDVIAGLHRASAIAAPPWLKELHSRYATDAGRESGSHAA